ncbi:MAG: magnesium transporter [Clostridia bacterium]|nr:magnesium transporter [Clostridia bacterium]
MFEDDTMLETIEKMLEEKEYLALRSTLTEMQEADIAALFGEMREDDLPLMFRILPKEMAASCFSYMEPEVQQLLIEEFSDRELTSILDGLFVDDAVNLIEEMPANVVHRIIQNVPPDKRSQINMILRYPKNSTGTIMTTEFVELREFMTRDDVFENIRRSGVDKETVYDCYVTDAARHLIGVISVKDLIMSENGEVTVGELMEPDVISVNAMDDREEAVNIMKKYGFIALPVTDSENRLIGIVTGDDAIEVLEEETTEDIALMAGMTASEKTYFMTSVFETWKNRVPWLMFLMISSVFTSKILQHFEGRLAANAALIAFMPVIMGTAGNAGGQSSATIIRALSTEEVKIRIPDILRIIWKELRVAFFCGLTLAAGNFLKMLAVDNVTVGVAVTVSVSIAAIVVIAKLIGALLPIGARKIGLDPAVMASPFITTICDALSLLLYFRAAAMILGI